MKRQKMLQVSGMLGLLLAAIASPVMATDNAGWYLGGNAGQSRTNIDDARIEGGLLSAGFVTTSIVDDYREFGFKVYGGYQFGKYVALEAGYFDLGDFGFTATTLPPGTLSGNVRFKGVNFDVVGILPLTDRFSVFGRVGANAAEAQGRFSGTGAVIVPNPEANSRELNLKFGGGFQYDISKSFGVRAEVERYLLDDTIGNAGDALLVSAGLLFRFGGDEPTPAPRVKTPAVVAAVPARKPQTPAVLLPASAPTKVTFSANSLFDFGKSTLNAEGRKALDRFAKELSGTDFVVITVSGHTDRIGSHAYNQALSTRRAEVVKAYLAESADISADKIKARGVNGSEPVTQPDECPGKKVTQELIDCLQPDRRVEVEVSGTQ